MRRNLLLLSMVVVSAALVYTATAENALHYGAVRTGLYERMEGDPPGGAGSGEWAGFAVMNVNPYDELLITNAVLKEGLPDTDYDVYVKVNGAVSMVGTLTTNPNGKGQNHSTLDVSQYTGPEGPGSIYVQVVVKPAGTNLIVGFASDTMVVSFGDDTP